MTLRGLIIVLVLPLLAVLLSCDPQKRLARKKHQYMESAYKTIKSSVSEAEVTVLNDSVKVLFPEHLLFQKGSSTINRDVYPLMQRFATALNLYSKTSILVNGYTDSSGAEELNKRLSAQRADSADALLKKYNVPAERLMRWGMGSTNPIADNSTENGRRKNRRVEFIILYNYVYDSK
jgi:outer membrane protein OmpA-like peptidoglycan-associated protein